MAEIDTPFTFEIAYSQGSTALVRLEIVARGLPTPTTGDSSYELPMNAPELSDFDSPVRVGRYESSMRVYCREEGLITHPDFDFTVVIERKLASDMVSTEPIAVDFTGCP